MNARLVLEFLGLVYDQDFWIGGTPDEIVWRISPIPYTPEQIAAAELPANMAFRIAELQDLAETSIDGSILPYTRSMLRDGVLAPAQAEGVREFIAATYEKVNSAIDQIEAATAVSEVYTVVPVWPVYGGAQ